VKQAKSFGQLFVAIISNVGESKPSDLYCFLVMFAALSLLSWKLPKIPWIIIISMIGIAVGWLNFMPSLVLLNQEYPVSRGFPFSFS